MEDPIAWQVCNVVLNCQHKLSKVYGQCVIEPEGDWCKDSEYRAIFFAQQNRTLRSHPAGDDLEAMLLLLSAATAGNVQQGSKMAAAVSRLQIGQMVVQPSKDLERHW
eukprot:6194404-Pleurochrysis_carterae.AAC.5